jgi:hypothetical protein
MARALLTDTAFPVHETELDLAMPADPDAVYWLRAITSEVAREHFEKFTKRVPNPRTHQREPVTDRPALQDALLDYCLVRWEGISNGSAAAPCDLEHKRKLPILLQAALVERAQIGQVTPEQQAASFRESASLVPVLEG